MLDLKDLRYFVLVYEQRGFGRAARQLNTVQSNVSAHIQRLEAEIGTALFERLHRSIRPTPKGEILYRHASRALENIAELEVAMRGRRVA